MKKNIVIIGVVVLIVGLILAALGPSFFTTSPQDLAADRDQNNLTYNSYSEGDRVTVYGRITYEGKSSFLGTTAYTYELNGDGDSENDGDFSFISGEDLGDVGNKIVVELQLQRHSFIGVEMEYWEATSTISPLVFMMPGIIALLVGAVLLLVGLVKKDSIPATPGRPAAPPAQPPYYYAPPEGEVMPHAPQEPQVVYPLDDPGSRPPEL